MGFFSSAISKPTNPLDNLPPSAKAAYQEAPEGNATLVVREVKPIESRTSAWKGIVWGCEITLDGGAVVRGGQKGVQGVDLMTTIQPKEGDLSTLDQAKDNGKIESRFGALYVGAGFELAPNDLGFLTPAGLSFEDPEIERALKSIEGRPTRVVAWTYKSKEGLGVGIGAVRED